MDKPLVIGIGEVLWDLLPKGKKLGGAPVNFAYHAHAIGAQGVVVSSVGSDDLGNEIRSALEKRRLETSFLQTHSKLPTGTVSVDLDSSGVPQYVINENVAWDAVNWEEDLTELARAADAVCFGTLAQRSFITRSTIHAFLQHTSDECLRIFDLNLRQSYYSPAIIEISLGFASILKLNEEEWPIVADAVKVSRQVPSGAQELLEKYELDLVAITRGSAGSILVTADGIDEQPAADVKVVDTVGAGDAFTAALTVGLLRGLSLGEAHIRATRLAGFVCTQHGATPSIPAEFYIR